MDYILYKFADSEWEKYTAPIILSNDGEQKVEFYAVDREGNVESVKELVFLIQKSLSEIEAYCDEQSQKIAFVGKVNGVSQYLVEESIDGRQKKIILMLNESTQIILVVQDVQTIPWKGVDFLSLQQGKKELVNFTKTRLRCLFPTVENPELKQGFRTGDS